MHGLTGFQRDLLIVLNGIGTSNGQEVKRELQNTQNRTILSGQLYHNLDILVDRGFVEKSERDGRTNEYTLSKRGAEILRGRYEWERNYLTPGLAPSL